MACKGLTQQSQTLGCDHYATQHNLQSGTLYGCRCPRRALGSNRRLRRDCSGTTDGRHARSGRTACRCGAHYHYGVAITHGDWCGGHGPAFGDSCKREQWDGRNNTDNRG